MSLFHSPQTCGVSVSSRTCCKWRFTHLSTYETTYSAAVSLTLAYSLSRLSGLSPFLGDDDNETLNNILACQWNFEEEEFADISDEAKDFITRLLVKSKSWRMSAAESLRHPWLSDRTLHNRLNQKVKLPQRVQHVHRVCLNKIKWYLNDSQLHRKNCYFLHFSNSFLLSL